ncbi:MAG TPA: sigma-54-dependent Fis family transcriptional regulator [Gammaproteobacteria bacterium]|nr:sigma-54-dependent Fis family transcriptional regulator [Gammaproteobacteria bacterium]
MNADKPILLIIDDDPVIRDSLQFVLEEQFAIWTGESRNDVKELLIRLPHAPDAALLDLGLPPDEHSPEQGFALIGDLLAVAPSIKILVLSGQDDRKNVKHALALGAFDFVAKPCDIELLKSRLSHSLFIRDAEYSLQQETAARDDGFIGDSLAMKNLRAQIEQFRDTPFPVLVEGPSGSGKELVGRALHEDTSRAGQPYLVINCAAMSSQLIEAQLFGHAKGAFTGANAARAGFFEEAEKGTLCLDEVGELPLELQAKLLRVLENGEFYRIGETQVRRSSARIIALTNRDLRTEVANGGFREDLYHRLSVFRIQVPPVAERGDDRLLMLDHFNRFYSSQLNVPSFELRPEALKAWRAYTFPGNVRELKNIVVRLAMRLRGGFATLEDLTHEFDIEQELSVTPNGNWTSTTPPSQVTTADSTPQPATTTPSDIDPNALAAYNQLKQSSDFKLDDALRYWEKLFITAALKEAGGNLSKASRMLGVNRTTLYSRMQKYPELQPNPD